VSYVSDIADAERWLSDWQTQVVDKAERAQELAARLTGMRATARSRDGRVRVTVDNSGVPTDILLDESVEGWQASRIAAEIMATMRHAQGRLTEQVEQAAADTVGAGSETATTVLTPYHQRFGIDDGDRRPDGRPA
jgi:DNA-binding protein YbaB